MDKPQHNIHHPVSFLRRYVFLLFLLAGCTNEASDSREVPLPPLPQNSSEEARLEQISYLTELISEHSDPPAHWYKKRAQLFLENRKENLAIADFEAALEKDSLSAEVALGLARAYRIRRDTAEALRWGRRAEKLGSSSPKLWKLLGELFLKREDYKTAIRYLDRYRQLYPESATAFFGTGKAFRALADTAEALYRYRQALCYTQTDSLPIYLDMIDLYAEHNEWFRARQLARTARAPEEPKWLHAYARIQWRLGKTDSALILWRQAVRQDSTFWPAQRRLGAYYFVRRVYAQALPHLRLSLRYQPEDRDVALWLGHIAEYRERNYERALNYYQQAARQDTLNPEIQQRLRRIRWRQRQDSLRKAGVLPVQVPKDSTE